ncbi:MAG: type II toxin-antitoxin system HicB family antitoxin [Dehalococcoidia bacterium]|nr:type II toxin-antitoxin system HicB family antitoxin [Dehalococcoidia bacterium]
MKYIYSAVFHPEEEGGYSIWFPDINQGATQGETLSDGVENAEDFLCGALYDMEVDGEQIPTPTAQDAIKTEGKEFVALISVDTDDYRRWHETRLVNKTLVLPSWLNERAVAAKVNFSQLLQTALKNELQLAAVE